MGKHVTVGGFAQKLRWIIAAASLIAFADAPAYEGAVEKQRHAEADDVFGAFAGRKPLRIEAAQAIARVGQIVARRVRAITLEIGACGDQIRRVGARGRQARLFGRSNRGVELPPIVELPRAGDRVVSGARRRGCESQNNRRAHQATHVRDRSTRNLQAGTMRLDG